MTPVIGDHIHIILHIQDIGNNVLMVNGLHQMLVVNVTRASAPRAPLIFNKFYTFLKYFFMLRIFKFLFYKSCIRGFSLSIVLVRLFLKAALEALVSLLLCARDFLNPALEALASL